MSQEVQKESKHILGPSVMTRFEKARVLGARALQVSMGAPPLLESTLITPIEIADQELREGVLPMTIRRRLPDGRHQDIPLKWLIKNQ
ncbi:MAG: DNA-directed RNA polymerase subunit K [Candidatus Methanomethyliaceae archaeon]|nr:DNA-directed RNA polymerase subunit K [Candidatus Methanomethyliaceae archaeon]